MQTTPRSPSRGPRGLAAASAPCAPLWPDGRPRRGRHYVVLDGPRVVYTSKDFGAAWAYRNGRADKALALAVVTILSGREGSGGVGGAAAARGGKGGEG